MPSASHSSVFAAASAGGSSSAGGSTSSGPSGVSMPLGDMTHYTQLIAQDFTTNAAVGQFANVYSGWAGYDGNTSGASGVTWNSTTTMSVHDGMLDFRSWVSGGAAQCGALTPLVPNTGGWYQQGWLYGRYVVRFKSDAVPGFKMAWLLWPKDNDWSEGEIDFPEANLDSTITAAAHNVTGDTADEDYHDFGVTLADGNWHTATITWLPGSVTFDLDSTKTYTVTDPTYLTTNPMRWDLQMETEINGQTPNANANGHTYIDWMVAYQYTGS